MTKDSYGTEGGRNGSGLGLILIAAALAYPAGFVVWLLGHGWLAALCTLFLGGPLLALVLAAASALRGSDLSRSGLRQPRVAQERSNPIPPGP